MFAFTRSGDTTTQAFARELGATWAGSSTEAPPEPLDAAILFAAAGELVPPALEAVEAGGTVVCAEIHMSDIPSFPYELLWRERVLRSVANLTWADGRAVGRLHTRTGLARRRGGPVSARRRQGRRVRGGTEQAHPHEPVQ